MDDFQLITLGKLLRWVVAAGHDFVVEFNGQSFADDAFLFEVIRHGASGWQVYGLLIDGNGDQCKKSGAITLKSGTKALNSWPSSVIIW